MRTEEVQELKCHYCLRTRATYNSEGFCNAACQRSRLRMLALHEDIATLVRESDNSCASGRFATTLGQACRAWSEQLAKDADVFKTTGQSGLELDFRQRAQWCEALADEIENGP